MTQNYLNAMMAKRSTVLDLIPKCVPMSVRGHQVAPPVNLTDVSQMGVQRHLLRSLIDFRPGSFEEFHRGHRDGRFVYFDTEYDPGTVIKLSEKSGPKGRIFQHIAAAAVDWDGHDPIRTTWPIDASKAE